MKTFKFSLVLRTRENTDVFITLDDNIYGIHSKRVNILYVFTALKCSNNNQSKSITKTCPYNFYPLKPHFYILKLGFTGVYIIALICAQNIDCGYLLELPRRGGSNEYPQSMF